MLTDRDAIVLLVSVTVGLTLGVLVDYLVLRHGWKPALLVIALVAALFNIALVEGSADPVVVVVAVATFGSAHFVARPLLKRLLLGR